MPEELENIPQFDPWEKYPDHTPDRLTVVAEIIRRVRHEAVLLHEPGKGDTNWGLGCRAYERTCFEFKAESPMNSEWLAILPEIRALQFSFAIGSIPFRFYRGLPNDPPDRYTNSSFGELHHLQFCLELEGMRPPDNILRLAVETSPVTLEVSSVSVVEVDTAGNPIAVFSIPQVSRSAPSVLTLQSPPVELAPPVIEPLTNIREISGAEIDNAQTPEIPETDTGS
jgi:hypothetical protein